MTFYIILVKFQCHCLTENDAPKENISLIQINKSIDLKENRIS